jgi:hypothetical protein
MMDRLHPRRLGLLNIVDGNYHSSALMRSCRCRNFGGKPLLSSLPSGEMSSDAPSMGGRLLSGCLELRCKRSRTETRKTLGERLDADRTSLNSSTRTGTSRNMVCAGRPGNLGEVEVPQPRGVRGGRLDRPRGQPIVHRRLAARPLHRRRPIALCRPCRHRYDREGADAPGRGVGAAAGPEDAAGRAAAALSRFGSPQQLGKVHWVRPEVAVEVTYLTWTEDNLLRQVSYQAQCEDKPARQVVRPVPHSTRSGVRR